MAHPQETATLVVKGRFFDDWEDVWVQHRWADDFPLFRFTAAERSDMEWLNIQFQPEDSVIIYLGGMMAMNGYILTRQVAYDANQHGVQLSGVGSVWAANTSSTVHETGDLDGKTFEEIARKLYEPYDVKVEVIGTIDSSPIERVQLDPGPKKFAELEQLGRARGIIMGSDHLKNVLLIGDHDFQPIATLKEGENILRMQAIWSIENGQYDIRADGQGAQTDGHEGGPLNNMQAIIRGSLSKIYRPLLIRSTHQSWNIEDLKKEVKNERKWQNAQNIQVTVTVQGWFSKFPRLWKPGDEVIVDSPMAMLDASSMGVIGAGQKDAGKPQQLKIEQVTFAQSRDQGTTTTLLLKAPWALNGGKSGHNLNPLEVINMPEPQESGPVTTPTMNDVQQWLQENGVDVSDWGQTAPEQLSNMDPQPTGPNGETPNYDYGAFMVGGNQPF